MDKTAITNEMKILFARNLDRAMRRRYAIPYGEDNRKQSQLAGESTVSQKAISNYLSPLKLEKQDMLDEIPAATIDNVALIAKALQIDPWQLLQEGEESAPINADEAALLSAYRSSPNTRAVIEGVINLSRGATRNSSSGSESTMQPAKSAK